ncbi:nb-arc and ankyrin domain containing protein [Grosmannia clavigera kw1407]|uniref:Nb-arc and ankyrin domain containing protein n=1 Tax=Grosmannia clavigera (strain kw1407 / UAMH 11150) TaxID=655863 RepID=F0XCK9_GROCL|nr:nb-arc and ankyrin domain containing protein [Grosmannia clavigera kw1407]EFX04723.1 nb-arc and ankyrin domain containing protein [Grosmannia clavigera kw1407]
MWCIKILRKKRGTGPELPFPDGVKVLHDCPDAAVDICFVHGLTGNRESTWTAKGQTKPWPKTLLPQTLSDARILTYGYDAYVVRAGVAGSNRLIDHAINLLHDLVAERASCGASSRPLIFVAHSLGGLVCKLAILRSRNNAEDHLHGVFDCVKGVVFMGTPHRGAWMADWAKIPVSALAVGKTANTKLLDILQRDNQLLESIQSDFVGMVRELQQSGRRFEVVCFFEEIPLPVFGKVVSKDSATFDGYDPITIHANHMDMVRFASAEENGFKRLNGELTRWKGQIDSSKPAPQLSEIESRCLKSLAFPAMHDRSNDIDRAAGGTCEWLLQHEQYTSWASRDQGLMWIKGKPGSGKSTLLKHALGNQRILSSAKKDDLVLSFFFHDRGDSLQRTPLGFSRSLIHQVLSQSPVALSDLIKTFKRKCVEIGEPGNKWDWHQGELQRCFESSISAVLKERSVWLFVDALDECGRDSAVELFQWFKSLLQTLPQTLRFHICVTCRHYPIIGQTCDFEICPEKENHKDISLYVRTQLSGARELAESSIPSLLTNAASGVFMWARLVVKQILDLDNEGKGLEEIKQRISDIPPELGALYRKLVEDMQEKQASLKLIQWVLFATRPLKLKELRWAMAIEPGSPQRSLEEYQKSKEFVTSSDRMKRRLEALSCGLVEAIASFGNDEDEYDSDDSDCFISGANSPLDVQNVQFIHQSVKDFFMDNGLLALDDSSASYKAATGKSHYQLSRTCLRYLMTEEIEQSKGFKKDVLIADFPLLKYAIKSWLVHTKRSEDQGVPQDDLLELTAWPSNSFTALWRLLDGKLEFGNYYATEGTGATTLVHVAAIYDITGLLSSILQKTNQSTLVDSKDNNSRTPLLWAAWGGHEAVVRLLLATGQVNTNSKDDSGRTPLSRAAWGGHEAVVRLLLATGQVDTDSKDDSSWTPLLRAAIKGHKAVVRLLLATGQVDTNSKDKEGRTPLLWAAEEGHEAVVRLLLATGQVNTDSKDNNGRTPLLRAAWGGHEAIVRLLLATGQVDTNSKDDSGQTPLSRAAGEGHEAVVRLLLATGQVDTDSKDNNGRTPLSWAARRGHNRIVEILSKMA